MSFSIMYSVKQHLPFRSRRREAESFEIRLLTSAATCGLLLWSLAGAVGHAAPAPATLGQFAARPLYFEINAGQADPQAAFLARPPGVNLLFSPTQMALTLKRSSVAGVEERRGARASAANGEVASMIVEFANANRDSQISGSGELPGRIHYLIGADPARWRSGIPAFSRLGVSNLYAGIDLVYYGQQQSLEYDFVVAPGAQPEVIRLQIHGADELEIDAQGDLLLKVGDQFVRQHKPVIYQWLAGRRVEVAGGYCLQDRYTVGFEVADYDRQSTLIIDPILSFSTYFGGSGSDTAWDVALDSNGNIYMAGETRSANLPVANAFQTNYAGGFPNGFGDAFVAKFDNSGTNLLYLTYLGGSGNDGALGLAVDANGSAYLAGYTDSTNFPLQNAISNSISGTAINGVLHPYDAFVAKLSPGGNSLVYSTYWGGDDQDQGIGIAVDSAGAAYVTGYTESTNFPAANALNTGATNNTLADAFVTKILPAGNAPAYSILIGGTAVDHGEGIAVDASGVAYITGYTGSTNLPLVMAPTNYPATNAFQPFLGGGRDAFLTRINPAGTVAESTFLGGLGDDLGFRVALDNAGNPYVTGSQGSFGFPVTPGPLNPGGVYKSGNAAGSWQASNAGLFHNEVGALILAPGNPAVIYVGTGRGVARSADAGASWQSIYDAAAQGRALVAHPSDSSIIFAGVDTSVFKLISTGTNWLRLGTNLSTQINALIMDPGNAATLYAGTEAGVFRSTNSATNWITRNSGLGSQSVLDLAVVPGTTPVYYAATLNGVYRSTNNAGNWHTLNNGLTNLLVQALAIDPVTPSIIYAGTLGGLFRSTNSGINWTFTGVGPSNIATLTIDPTATATIYAGTAAGVFKTVNGGFSWTLPTNGVGRPSIGALAIDPTSPATVYAGIRGVSSFGGSDAFVTKFNAAGSNQYSVVFGGINQDQGWDLAIDPNGNVFVAGTTRSSNFPTNNTPTFLNATNGGLTDGFVTAINANGSAYLYSTYIGGRSDDAAVGIEVDSASNAYVVGDTASTNFPVFNARDSSFNGTNDAFLLKIQWQTPAPELPALTVWAVGNNLQVSWPAIVPEFTLESTTNLSGTNLSGTIWTPVGPSPPASNGWHTVTVTPAGSRMFFRLRR